MGREPEGMFLWVLRREDFKTGDCDNVSVLGIELDGDLSHWFRRSEIRTSLVTQARMIAVKINFSKLKMM